jgi:hypothetical protein
VNELGTDALHLLDEEIDDYCRGRLDGRAQARVEEHYLACEACHERVRFVEDLVAAVQADRPAAVWKPRSAWRVAAAVLLLAGAAAAWRWARPSGAPPDRKIAAPAAAIRLVPPTRDGGQGLPRIPAGRDVRLSIDVREAGAPGTRFDVTISTARGEMLFERHDLPSSPSGELEVAIGGGSLSPGEYLLEASTAGVTIGLPLEVSE